ncbi:MAG TPA: hypothetical protein VIL04_04720 [Solirubrobacterales bacterium]
MNRKFAVAALAAAAALTIALVPSAGAGGKASTKVTIKGPGEVFGFVKSNKPVKCAKNRKVVVFRVRPGKDKRIASDTASKNGNRYQWSIGNPGLSPGRYYAKAPATPNCKGAKSKILRVERPL